MIPLVIRLPLDPLGTSPDNLIVREPHTTTTRRFRAIATNYGGFFAESLKVYDDASGQELRPDQFYAAEMYQVPTHLYSKKICAVVIVTDPSLSPQLSVTYQAVGDVWSTSQQAIVDQLERLQLDNRPVAWGDIINKPSGFTPSAHLHDAGDIYGFEYVVFALDRIRDAIALGDAASHDAIYRYVDHQDGVLKDLIDQNAGNFRNHVADFNNPHRLTAGQINAFTKPETTALVSSSLAALSASLNARVDSEVLTLNQSINTVNGRLSTHMSDNNNPHHLTPGQIGVWTAVETQAAITAAVNSAVNTLNTRITQEIAAVNGSINAVSADASNRFNGAYRGHVGITTNGSAPNYTITPDAALKLWLESSWVMKVVFHAANGTAPTSLGIVGSAMNGPVRCFNSDGIEVLRRSQQVWCQMCIGPVRRGSLLIHYLPR